MQADRAAGAVIDEVGEKSMTIIRKAVLAGTLGAAALTAATPAMADDWRWRRHHGGDTTGAAVAGGIIGLALGAAIASNGRDRDYDDYYYDRRYRHPRARVYVYHQYPRYYSGWDRPAYRYYYPRERYYRGYNGYGGYYGYGRGW